MEHLDWEIGYNTGMDETKNKRIICKLYTYM